MKSMLRFVLVLLSVSVFALSSCGDSGDGSKDGSGDASIDDTSEGTATPEEIASMKEKISALSQPANLENGTPKALTDEALEEPVVGTPEQTLDETGTPVTYTTTTQKFKASAAFDTQVLLNPGSDVIYPGSVLIGSSIDDGSYVEVTSGTKRKVKISYDLTGVKTGDGELGKVSGMVLPSLSNYRDFHNEILSQEIPKQSSIYSYEATEINDETEMDLKFSAGAKYVAPAVEVSVKAGFDYSKSNSKHKYMVKFMQTFYTVDLDQASGTFLYDDFNIDDFGGYRPVYVASVAYGRLAYLTIESTESWESIKANLDVVVNTATSGEYDASFESALNKFKTETKFNITVIGGTTVATSVEGFDEFLKEGGFSSENAGKIISYKLRFVDDNTVANTVFNGEYTMRSTTAVQGKGIKVGLRIAKLQSNGSDAGGNMELYGSVYYSPTTTDAKQYLFSKSAGDTYNIGETETKTFADASATFPILYYTFNNGSEQLQVTQEFKENDTTGDDTYRMALIQKTISELNNGDTFTLRSFDGSAFMECTFVVTKEFLY